MSLPTIGTEDTVWFDVSEFKPNSKHTVKVVAVSTTGQTASDEKTFKICMPPPTDVIPLYKEGRGNGFDGAIYGYYDGGWKMFAFVADEERLRLTGSPSSTLNDLHPSSDVYDDSYPVVFDPPLPPTLGPIDSAVLTLKQKFGMLDKVGYYDKNSHTFHFTKAPFSRFAWKVWQRIPPKIIYAKVEKGTTLTTSNFVLFKAQAKAKTYSAPRGNNIEWIEMYLDGVKLEKWDKGQAEMNMMTVEYQYPLSKLSEGWHTLLVKAKDSNGNVNSVKVKFQYIPYEGIIVPRK